MLKKCILLILLAAINLFAGDVFTEKCLEAINMLHDGYNTWNETEMQKSLGLFERILNLDRDPWLVHYYIGLCHYRLSTLYMDEKNKDKAGRHLDEAIDHLELCKAQNDTFPESYALIASCMGNKIGLAPWKGMVLGPKSGAQMQKAFEYGPENPRVWLLQGISSNFSPKMFGGGKQKALDELRQAIEYFEADAVTQPLYPSWGHDLAYAWIGVIKTERQEWDAAQKALEKGLELNPQNGWIRHQLLPELAKKKNEK